MNSQEKIDEFAALLYKNHILNNNLKLKEKNEFKELLLPVVDIVSKCEKKDISRLYEELYKKSGIDFLLKELVYTHKLVSGISVSFGTSKYSKEVFLGNQQEVDDNEDVNPIPMKSNSIYDLASITKIFTCIVILKLVEEKQLRLTDTIKLLDKRFTNLSDVTIRDLLSFNVVLKTSKRIEECITYEELKGCIFSIDIEETPKRLYSDMGAMVLKYVAEEVTEKSFYELVYFYILKPCEMYDTYIEIPSTEINRVVSNNLERRIYKGKDGENCYKIINDIHLGVVSDGKARGINKFEMQLHGHAGLFSTVKDMGRFSKSLMGGKIISRKLLGTIGIDRTSQIELPDGNRAYHGYLCYVKNPSKRMTEVNHLLSAEAFALGGYTGNQLTIDCKNDVFVFMASNRCHNRVTSVPNDIEISSGYVKWNNGRKYVYTKDYVYVRDEYVIEPVTKLVLQYKFLEYLLETEDFLE